MRPVKGKVTSTHACTELKLPGEGRRGGGSNPLTQIRVTFVRVWGCLGLTFISELLQVSGRNVTRAFLKVCVTGGGGVGL